MPHAEIPRSQSHAYERVSRDALGQRIADLVARPPVQLDLLRSAVCDYVSTRKGIGDPPEQVLAQVKSIAVLALTSRDVRADATSLVEQVVRWCIDEYYRRADAPAVETPEPDYP